MGFLWFSYGFPMARCAQGCFSSWLDKARDDDFFHQSMGIYPAHPMMNHRSHIVGCINIHRCTYLYIYICMYVYVNMYIVIYLFIYLSSYLCIFSSYIYKYCIHVNIVYIHMHINDIHHNIPMMYPHLRMIALMDPSNVSSLSMVPFINPGNITLSKPYIICWPSPTRWNYYFLFLYGITITIYIVICPVICCVDLYMLFHLGQTPWTPGRKKNNNHIFTIYY